MKAAKPIKDTSLKNGLKWLVPGSVAGSKKDKIVYGTWELVIDASTNRIVHWLFKPNK